MADRLPVVCRPARPDDKQAVLEMTRRIWEGEDYIPYVWDAWLADPEGQLAVAEAQGLIVGMGKISKLGPGEWLLSGLRTHPDMEGRGIASQMHHYLVGLWEQIGDGTLRLLTSSKRLPVHHLSDSTGFDKVAEYTVFQAPALPGEAHAFHPLQAEDVEAALQFATASPLLRFQFGLMDMDWAFLPPSSEIIGEAVGSGNAFWWEIEGGEAQRQGFLAAYEEMDERHHEGAERTYAVRLLACSLESLGRLLVDFRRLAGEKGCQKAQWMAGAFPELDPHLQAAGYERAWDAFLYVFARPHPTRPKIS